MKEITLGWLSDNITFLLALCGGLFGMYKAIKKAFEVGLKPLMDKMTSMESSLKEEMKKIDMNSTKNFLVARINEIEQDQKLDPITMERFWEQYEHYTKDLDGNTYIKTRVEHLKKKKKI